MQSCLLTVSVTPSIKDFFRVQVVTKNLGNFFFHLMFVLTSFKVYKGLGKVEGV